MDKMNPKHIENKIKMLKNGGVLQEMPADIQADLEQFRNQLDVSTDEAEKDILRKAISSIEAKYLSDIITEETMDEVDKADGSINEIVDGNWFKDNPSKLLGDLVVTTDRYKKEITILEGDISVLDGIVVNDSFGQFIKQDGAISSVRPSVEELLTKHENKVLVEKIIKKSESEIGKKAVQKQVKKEKKSMADFSLPQVNVQDYKQVAELYNKDISNEELKAYIWYKNEIGQTLSNNWYEMAYTEKDSRSKDEMVRDWVKNGVLFYVNGELTPKPIFASGDMYQKYTRLVKSGENSGQDADYIIENYGEDVLKHHLEVLNEAWRKVYDKRLIITGGVDENSLVLKPVSKFAKEYMIERTESMQSLKWYKSGRKDSFGEPDITKNYGRGWKEYFPQMSLTNAFAVWMLKQSYKLKLKGNITVEDIIYFYIQNRNKVAAGNTPEEKAKAKALLERTKAKSMTEGNRLFLQFLKDDLSFNQKVAIETSWNAQYNNYLKPDYNQIPVAFNVTENFHGEEPFIIKQEKRDAVSFIFNEGSGCLAYDVGVGKTMSALMIIEQFIVAGYCKRPYIVVPNQTYKQWISEIQNLLPHRPVVGLYNLRKDFLEEITDENGEVIMIPEGSISVLTYEGFEQIGFGEDTERDTLEEFYEILNQGGADEQLSEKKKAGLFQKLEELVGRGLEGTKVEIEKLGFDFMCFDEAHALKKVFTSVKGEAKEGKKQNRKQYSIESGIPSGRALKGFMMSQYILRNNNYRNVLLLTATPFTNSPLEVFSMLSMVGYHQLAKLGLNNINDFFDNYIDVSTELVINHKLKPQYRQVVKGFNNLPSMQRIIMRFFDYKDGEMVGVPRPNKIMIPYEKEVVNGEVVKLSKDKEVTSNIELSPLQQNFMDGVIAYAEGKGELEDYFEAKAQIDVDGTKLDETDSQAEEVDEAVLEGKDKAGVRALKSMNFSRNIALSPYLFEYSGLGEPTYTEYINTSPKLKYVMECIRSVVKYHKDNKEPVSGQVIYMDRGLKYFPLIQEYLIKELGFAKHEVGIISAKVSKNKAIQNQDAFLGRKWNEKTQEYDPMTDEQRMKIIIGSSKIREGMNLQKKSTVLYNCFVDWNPTDFTQLAGRIWRQGNQYENVRIVNPLMIDSIDIFMFQKLEEKTARINTIWSNNGESVLRLEDIDPEDIKMNLIKDPVVIAQLESEIRANKIIDDIASYKGVNDRLQGYLDAFENINRWGEQLSEYVEKFAPSKANEDNIEKIRLLINFWKQEYPKDENGKLMISDYQRNYQMDDIFEKFGKDVQLSPFNAPSKPFWFSGVVESKRLMDKETKDVLVPRNIEPEVASIRAYIEDGENIIKKLKEEDEFLKSEDYIGKRVVQILAKREAEKFEIKTIDKLVNEFERLNPLLSKIKIKDEPKKKAPKYDSCVFVDKNGVPKIDDESIAMLTECVEALPQTKTLHTDEEGNYTKEREKVHRAIIEEVKSNAQCIENDEQPIAILTGGSPASGKSSFLRHYAPFLDNEEIFKIDADEVRAKLPEYKGYNATATHLETKDIINRLLTDKEIGIPCKFDLIYDGTMNSTKNYLPLIGTLKRLGYKVFIVYMDNVPYEEVRKRMLERYQKSGRFVPVSVIDDFFGKGKAALDELKNKVDGYMVVDASNRDYNIIEDGGIKLPTERDYSKIGSPFTVAEARGTKKSKKEAAKKVDVVVKETPAKAKPSIEDLEKRLKTVRLMAKKNPALKARAKVVNAMLKKAKANPDAYAQGGSTNRKVWGVQIRRTDSSPYEEVADNLTKEEAETLAAKLKQEHGYHLSEAEIPLPFEKGGDIENQQPIKRLKDGIMFFFPNHDRFNVYINKGESTKGFYTVEHLKLGKKIEISEDTMVYPLAGVFQDEITKKGIIHNSKFKYDDGGEVISDGGNYISINATKDKMIIKLNEDGIEEVLEMKEDGKSSSEIMAFLFEDVVANSELQWHDDLGQSGLGMTNASGVTDGYYYEDDGTYTSDWRNEDTRLYYFNDYALRSEVDDLLTEEGLVLTGADNKMADGGEVEEVEYAYDEDGNKYIIDWGSGKQFVSGDMAYNPMSDLVMEVYFNENDEDADDEYYVQNTYASVTPVTEHEKGGDVDTSDEEILKYLEEKYPNPNDLDDEGYFDMIYDVRRRFNLDYNKGNEVVEIHSDKFGKGGATKVKRKLTKKDTHVLISKTKDDWWVVSSRPATKYKTKKFAANFVPVKGETAVVTTVNKVRKHNKVMGKEYLD